MTLNFIIETIIKNGDPDKNYNVITKIEFDPSEKNSVESIKASIVDQYRRLFELESLTVSVLDKKNSTYIKISTRNEEKVEMIRKNMASMSQKYKQSLPPINLN